jgi:prophage tail gpP-like protein
MWRIERKKRRYLLLTSCRRETERMLSHQVSKILKEKVIWKAPANPKVKKTLSSQKLEKDLRIRRKKVIKKKQRDLYFYKKGRTFATIYFAPATYQAIY